VIPVHSKGLDYGYFSISCAIKNSNINKTIKTITKEFQRLKNETIPKEELERNKKMILSGILRGIDNPEECQDILAFMEIQFNKEQALINYLEKIKAVTAQEILSVAETYLQQDNLTTAILAPK